MTRIRSALRALLVTLAMLAAGLVGACDKSVPLPQFVAADVPRPDLPRECTADSPAEPAPPAAALQTGLDAEASARATRAALLWGRDLAGLRMICRAWLSAYVAERWPAETPGKPARQKLAAKE